MIAVYLVIGQTPGVPPVSQLLSSIVHNLKCTFACAMRKILHARV